MFCYFVIVAILILLGFIDFAFTENAGITSFQYQTSFLLAFSPRFIEIEVTHNTVILSCMTRRRDTYT